MNWLKKLIGLNDKPAQVPICAESGQPKDPRACWNVRCQLGGTCCRATAAGVHPVDGGQHG